MPELTGWTETERVRQQEKERFVRITGLKDQHRRYEMKYPQKITEKE